MPNSQTVEETQKLREAELKKHHLVIEEEVEEMPISFNHQYSIISLAGTGKSAIVYKAQQIVDPTKIVAIKIIKEEYLRSKTSKCHVQNEIKVL